MTDTLKDDLEPLMDPTELAGTVDGAIAAEFAARDAMEAIDAAEAGDATATGEPTSDELPLDGE